jgi:hypothetical protein
LRGPERVLYHIRKCPGIFARFDDTEDGEAVNHFIGNSIMKEQCQTDLFPSIERAQWLLRVQLIIERPDPSKTFVVWCPFLVREAFLFLENKTRKSELWRLYLTEA